MSSHAAVGNVVSRTPLLSRTEMLTLSLEKSAVTRRPRSLGDRPFGVWTFITMRRMLVLPFGRGGALDSATSTSPLGST